MTKRSKKQLKDVKPAPFRSLFRFATKCEIFFLIIAVLCTIGVGMVLPISFFFMGGLLDSFYQYQSCILATDNNCTLHNVLQYNNHTLANESLTENGTAIEYINVEDVFIAFALKFTFAGVVSGVLGFFQCLMWAPIMKKQIQRIRINFLRSVLRQDMEWIDKTSIGELNIQLSGDITHIFEGINVRLANFVQEMSTFLTSLVMGLVLDWRLSLLLAGLIPFIILGGFITIKILMFYSKKERKAYSMAGNIALSVFSSVKVVAAYGNQQNEVERYEKNLHSAEKIGIRRSAVYGLSHGYLRGSIYLILSVAIWFSWLLMVKIDPSFTTGRLYTVFFVIVISALYLGKASPYLATLGLAKASAAIVFATMDRVSKIDSESECGIAPSQVVGDIVFNEVDFSYSTRNIKILNKINVEFQCGKTVAIVGPSGSGKTTLLSLIQRMYQPDDGTITLDGKDIKEYNVSYLRDLISIVHQSPFLFNTTIRENIALGGEDVDEADIFQAAKDANAFNFIQSLPQKFETVVGEKGGMLSGGQQQRICLARALIKKPKILLLDQTTSALDNENELEILENLKRGAFNRTTIFTTHRINTIQNADVIIAMDKGKIAEVGTHDELMKNKDVYFSLMSVSGKNNNEKKISAEVNSGIIDYICEDTISEWSDESEDENESDVQGGYFFSTLKLNGKEWPFILSGSLASLLAGIIWPAYGLIVALTIKYMSQRETMYDGVYLLCPILAGIFLLVFVTTFFKDLLYGISGEKLTRRVRTQLFSSILQHNVDWFDRCQNNPSNLNARLARDAPQLKKASGESVGTLIEALACSLCGCAVGFMFSWKLTLLTILVLPLIVVGHLIRSKLIATKAVRMKNNELEAINIATQAIGNIHTVASLGRQSWFVQQYSDIIKVPLRTHINMTLLDSILFSAMCIMSYIPQAICFRFSGFLLINHQIRFHDIFIVFMVLHVTGMILGRLFLDISESMKGHSSANRIFELLNEKPENDGKPGCKPNVKGDISFKNCTFAYPNRPEANALKDFNVSISSGQTLALIGQSGCGKSTTVQLLERFYNINKGSIMIDGVDISKFDLQHLRSCIGIVFQDPILFGGTILENIIYGINSGNYTKEDAIHAAQIANIHDFILTLEKGYDTHIGEGGNQLSKGEKQRISVARALIRNPKILILDEATSSLDYESERIVQNALDKACIGRTCIVIAHRLSTIRNANKIAVMHDGEVVEYGDHDELMKKEGAYFSLISNVQTLS